MGPQIKRATMGIYPLPEMRTNAISQSSVPTRLLELHWGIAFAAPVTKATYTIGQSADWHIALAAEKKKNEQRGPSLTRLG